MHRITELQKHTQTISNSASRQAVNSLCETMNALWDESIVLRCSFLTLLKEDMTLGY